MFPFLAPQSLSKNSLVAATKVMLKVARTDGLHPAEIALIEGFYSSSVSGAGSASFESVLQSSEDFQVGASSFETEEEREMVVALGVMTGLADGIFSETEQTLVREIAASLGVSSERFVAIADGVKDQLLAQLSHLPDAGSVAAVAKELG